MLFTPDPAEISRFMACQRACGFDFRNEVYRPALAGEYRLLEILPGVRVPARYLDHAAPPTLAICGDDAGISEGPRDFPQARRLAAWARYAMLHAAGGDAFEYSLVAKATRRHRRALLIETTTAAQAAWEEVLRAEIARRERASLPPLIVTSVAVPHNMAPHPSPDGAA